MQGVSAKDQITPLYASTKSRR